MVIKPLTNAAEPRQSKRGDSQMRSLSFIILAVGFVLAGSSMAGSADGDLPGVGTFAYSGTPIAGSSPALMVATR